MLDFLGQLKEKKIMSQKDIDHFRNYIDQKYDSLEDEKKQDILKNSIVYVVNRDLSELNIDDPDSFINVLVEKNLLEDKQDLFADTIFHRIVSQGKPSEGLLQSLTKWVSDKIEIPIHRDLLEKYYRDYSYSNENIASEDIPPLPSPTLSHKKISPWMLWCSITIIIFSGIFIHKDQFLFSNSPIEFQEDLLQEDSVKNILPAYVLQKYRMPNRNFPHYLYYRDINEENLKKYLASRNSLLEKEPYFSYILDTSREFQLNPLLLFAIAGHEQAFVPEDHPNSEIMVNNPFNVFGSWLRYNTNLKETSEIAARTAFNSLADLPPFIDPFFWMNRRYAEDPNWWRGIKAIFWRLEREC